MFAEVTEGTAVAGETNGGGATIKLDTDMDAYWKGQKGVKGEEGEKKVEAEEQVTIAKADSAPVKADDATEGTFL